MRTLRELAGWGVLLLLWVLPPIAATCFAFSVFEDGGVLAAAMGVVALVAWPGLRRIGRPWRNPPPEEHAEADGRRPVVLVHRSADQERPWYRRLFALQRGFWHASRDQRWREALSRSYAALGPVLPLARPARPPASGPAAMLRADPSWAPALRRRLKTARLAVIVLDATETCRTDIEAAFDVLGPRRTALIMPARPDSELAAVWPALQEVVPGLPAFDSHALAFRFDPDGIVLAMTEPRGFRQRVKQLSLPRRMLFSHEHDSPPKPPTWTLLAQALPALAGLLSTVAVPVLLDFEGIQVRQPLLTPMVLASVVLGITLSVMGRRQFRLVTANETPFVVVAALPWLTMGANRWMTGEWSRGVWGLENWLRDLITGAAYSAPLLLATSLMLSASALARRSPNRNFSYALFGVVALVPFATLVALLDDSGTYVFGIAQFLLAGALAAGVAVVAASGDSPRPHGPTPLGAGASAAMAVGAWATVVTSQQWRALITMQGAMEDIRGLSGVARSLVAFGEAWIWFLMAIPLLVVLVASLHHGRGSRTGAGSVWALAPMIVVFGLVSTAHSGARAAFSHAYVQSGGLMLTRAMPTIGDATLAIAPLGTGQQSPRPMDTVLTAEATYAGGVSIPRGSQQRRLPSQFRARSVVRIGVDRHTPAADVERLVGVFNAGGRNCALTDLDGWAVRVRSAPRHAPRDRVVSVLQLAPGQFAMASTDGSRRQVNSMREVENLLEERRILQPGSGTLFVQSDERTDAATLLEAVGLATDAGFRDLVLGVPPALR